LKNTGLASLLWFIWSVYLLQSTYQAAMLAAGCAVEAVDKVVKDELRHSMALVRYDLQTCYYNVKKLW